MTSDPLNCSGCRENLPSQRDHRCLVGGAADEVLGLFRLSPQTIIKERAQREMYRTALQEPVPAKPREARQQPRDCQGCREEQPSITDHSCMGF